ncbi:MAG: SDR family oxidoreductase [Nitrososphaeraceae archaeon]|nr:SDR family oxidoreductase [Nitrososphaeraceae archaeon]
MIRQQQPLERRTILVIGATGTVGSEVVKQIVSSSSSSSSDQNVIIRAAIHSQNKADKFKQYNKTVEIVNMDYNHPKTIADAIDHVDKLFLLTLPTPNMIDIYSDLVKEIRKYDRINHIVMLSSMAAGTALGTTIGRLHRQEEKIIQESGIPYTFLRPNAFMQNFINFFGQTIRNQNAFYLPAGDGKVSFVDARDIAAVAAQALTSDNNRYTGKAYIITGQEAISFGQAAESLSNAIGKRISYVDIPEEDARKEMRHMGMEEWLIDAMMESYSIIRAGHASQTTTVVEQITGRKPIPFTRFAKDHAKFFGVFL